MVENFTNSVSCKYFFKTFPILWLVWNVGYTTSKADKVKQGGFQRKPMTFCELADFDNFEGFPKSNVAS